MMQVHHYTHVPNFGDVLNQHLWEPYLGEFIGRDDGIMMLGIGTLLGYNNSHNGQIIVCGSGCGYGGDFSQIQKPNFKVFFVRGPLSAGVLGMPEDMSITDPAILTPEIFPAASKTGKTVFVPHWETSLNPLWKSACKLAGVEYVDPLAAIKDVIAAISGAKLVIAEAMHAAIIADAYRVPWVSISTSRRINAFKWQDWASSLGMDHSFQHYAPLGLSTRVQNLSIGRAKMFVTKNLRKEEHQACGQPDQSAQKNPKHIAKEIYKAVMPKRWQGGKDLEVMAQMAAHADKAIETLLQTGSYNRFYERTVGNIMTSAATTGQLSRDDIFHTKKLMLQERLKDVHTYLANYPSR